jgi:hypothetical protein
VQMFAELQAQVGESLRNGGATAQAYAERVIARLDIIAEGVLRLDTTESERAFESAFIEANTSDKIAEGRQGYISTIEHVSIIADGATTVDIYIGSEGASGFRTRLELAAAGRTGGALVGYKAPEGAAIIARAGAAGATVNVQLKREKIA